MRNRFFYILLIFFLFNSTNLSAGELEDKLIALAAFGQGRDVKHLLDEGADPNARNSIGKPVIVLAAGRGDKEAADIVKALIDAGADVNAFDKEGNNALIVATRQGSLETLNHILKLLPAMRVLDAHNNTLTYLAEMRDDYEILAAIEDATNAENDRLTFHQSGGNLSKLMKEFSFLYCAHGYLEFYVETGDAQDALQEDLDKESYQETLDGIVKNAEAIGQQLITYHEYTEDMLQEMRGRSKLAIVRELRSYQDINYRKLAGIGSDEDLNERCDKISKKWRTRIEKIEHPDEEPRETPWY